MRASAFLAGFGVLVSLAPTSCGSDGKKADAKADAKVEPTDRTSKTAEKPETKSADTPADDALHFDISKDRSGVLARAASTLETTDRLAADAPLREHLAELSHHAERGPSNEALCKHMATIQGDDAPATEACAKAVEHQRVKLGPEVFAEMAQCVTDAKSTDDLARCETAEKEAEELLHANKHGDGVDEKTCEDLFVHFSKLAMADAGDHANLVEEVLEEVRADVLEACTDHGTKAEVACAMEATDMKTLGECESSIL